MTRPCACAVFRRPGFHHLPRLGADALSACGDGRVRLWPAPAWSLQRRPIRDGDRDIAGWGARLGRGPPGGLAASMSAIGETALTADMAIAMTDEGLPNTFVPGRNLLFLTYAAAIAYRRGIRGSSPGCARRIIRGIRIAATTDQGDAACAQSRDAASVRSGDPADVAGQGGNLGHADALGGAALVDLILEHTHSCYLGDRSHRHEWGYGCGACPACELRTAGWARWRGSLPGGGRRGWSESGLNRPVLNDVTYHAKIGADHCRSRTSRTCLRRRIAY